jgi:hypothetical protein
VQVVRVGVGVGGRRRRSLGSPRWQNSNNSRPKCVGLAPPVLGALSVLEGLHRRCQSTLLHAKESKLQIMGYLHIAITLQTQLKIKF